VWYDFGDVGETLPGQPSGEPSVVYC
jgi:hypothetical protein